MFKLAVVGVPLALALALSACSPPDPLVVSGQAKAALQKQLAAQYPKTAIKVAKVDVVALEGPKYEGSATIEYGPLTFTLPVAVTSDGRTTLVTADDAKFKSAIQESYRRHVSVLEGKYSDYILSPSLMAVMPRSLRKEPDDFRERLETVMPVEARGRWFFGEGCKAHSCTSEMSAWAVHRDNGTTVAIVLKDPGEFGGADRSFRVYGADADTLPGPLRGWAETMGMNYMNVAEDVPEHIPPETQ